MDLGQQALRCLEPAFNECRVADQLRLGIADVGLAPRVEMALHRVEVALDGDRLRRRAYRAG